jgi:hypothetical protein
MDEYRELTVKRAARVMQSGLIDVRDQVKYVIRERKREGLVQGLMRIRQQSPSTGVHAGGAHLHGLVDGRQMRYAQSLRLHLACL